MNKISFKNTHALAIGLILILVIFLTTYLRFSYFQNDTDTNQLQDEINTTLEKAAKISTVQLAQKISSGEMLNLIDIREEGEYAREHLPDSVNIPLSTLRDSIRVLEKNKTYILINSIAELATTAYGVKVFSEAGFGNITYLEGGFAAWKNSYNQTISAGDPTSFSDQSKVSYITSAKLKEMLEKEKNIILIDVRKNPQYKEGHLKNAINIFLDDLESKRNQLPASGKIVLYDADGLGAFQAAVRLFDMGIFNAYTLSDGFNTWKSKNFEIVK